MPSSGKTKPVTFHAAKNASAAASGYGVPGTRLTEKGSSRPDCSAEYPSINFNDSAAVGHDIDWEGLRFKHDLSDQLLSTPPEGLTEPNSDIDKRDIDFVCAVARADMSDGSSTSESIELPIPASRIRAREECLACSETLKRFWLVAFPDRADALTAMKRILAECEEEAAATYPFDSKQILEVALNTARVAILDDPEGSRANVGRQFGDITQAQARAECSAAFETLKRLWPVAYPEQANAFAYIEREFGMRPSASDGALVDPGMASAVTMDRKELLSALAGVKEKWAKRKSNCPDNPAAFIARVYKPWLGGGLSRPILRAIDRELYQAYATWIRRHPDDDLSLPTRSDLTDAEIASLGLAFDDKGNPIEARRAAALFRTMSARASRRTL